jgi:4-carboxymuconolactone decarboxylase
MGQSAPRIPPATPEEWTETAREMFTVLEGPEARARGSVSNLVNSLAHSPELAHPFLLFSKVLLVSDALPARVREIAILRVAHRNACEYEWVQHLRIGAKAGLTEADFAAIRAGEARADWSPLERLALQAVDQLAEQAVIDDALWAALAEHLDRRQLLFLLFLIGAYTMDAWVFNSIGVQLEGEGR